MKISAVIPTYNYAHYLPEAIESVLRQTRKLDEIIIVDDGSKDNTREVAARYQTSIRYIHQTNAGLSAARNTGTRHATGDWVAYLDSDDAWAPEKILRQEQAIVATPGAVAAYTGYIAVYPNGEQIIDRSIPEPEGLWPRLRARNMLVASSMMARRETLLAAGGFDEKLTSCEDWDVWVRLKFLGAIAGTTEPLALIRQTPGSMSANIERMIANMEAIREKTLLRGLSGISRAVWTRKIRSIAYWHAAITARAIAASLERKYLLKSIAYWPLPNGESRRVAALTRNLIGPEAFSSIAGKIKPGLRSRP